MDTTMTAGDTPLSIKAVLWLQAFFGEESWAVWNVITELGTAPVFMVVIGFAFWQGRRSMAITALIAILLVGLIVDSIKVFTALPRPYYAHEMVAAWRDSTGFGMPSGHAAGAMTLWMMLAVFIRKRWFYLIAAVLIFFIGVSRMYFGVHSGTQVLLGWLLGVVVVLLILSLRKIVASWFEKANPQLLALAALATVMLLLGIQHFIFEPMGNQFTVPSLWSERFNMAVKFEDTLAGDEFKPKTLNLFNAIGLPEIGTIAGVWIILLWWKIKKQVVIYDEPVNGPLLWVTTTIGLVVIYLLIVLIDLTESFPLPAFVVWASVPVILTLVVPAVARRIWFGFIR